MLSCDHHHKVCDSRKRTLAIQVTDKIIEVIFDTLVVSLILERLMPLESAILNGLAVSLIIEGFCFFVGYLNLRLWNRIRWERKVQDVSSS